MLKRNISDIYSHKYMKIKINSHDYLPLEKTWNILIVVTIIKSAFNKITTLESFSSKNYFKMLFCDRIDVSEGIDVNKTRESKEDIICYYWYFLDKGFRFQPVVSNGSHDELIISIDIYSIATLNIDWLDYLSIVIALVKVKP